MLNTNEIDALYEEVAEKIREKLYYLNRLYDENEIYNYLETIGLRELCPTVSQYETLKSGKIVILGDAAVDKNIIFGIAKEFCISKDRFELCLDYDEVQKYNYRKLQYDAKYRVVLVGPMPHSTRGKGDYDSTIVAMEKEKGYPRVIRVKAGEELKITKSSLKEIFKQLIDEDYI